MSAAQILDAVRLLLPQEEFPGGATAGWWARTVQLDLEAKGELVRLHVRPLHFHLR